MGYFVEKINENECEEEVQWKFVWAIFNEEFVKSFLQNIYSDYLERKLANVFDGLDALSSIVQDFNLFAF